MEAERNRCTAEIERMRVQFNEKMIESHERETLLSKEINELQVIYLSKKKRNNFCFLIDIYICLGKSIRWYSCSCYNWIKNKTMVCQLITIINC